LVIVVVVGRSSRPLWAQYEGRGATSVSVIVVVSGSGVTNALLHAQNFLALADYSVNITGLDSSSRGPDKAMGLDDDRGLGEVTVLGSSRDLDKVTVRCRSMNGDALSFQNIVLLCK
jgi:hypothetical protein